MGIQMRSLRGQIGTTWLARELGRRSEMALGTRGRALGKKLARAGAVEWIDIEPGRVRASVTGADASIAHPELTLGPWRAGDLDAFHAEAARDPRALMAVLAGTYADDHEQQLSALGLGLLPGGNAELSFACTCLAWPAVCEHVFAVLYVLIEHVDAAPADYLTLLGIDIEGISLVPGPGSPGHDPAREGGGGRGAERPGAGDREPTPESDREPASEGETEDAPREDGNGDADGAGDGGSDDAPETAGLDRAPATRFSPGRLDSRVLTDMLSDDVAHVFAAFYAAAPAPAPAAAPAPDPAAEATREPTPDERTPEQ
ncbi:MAG: hypothetical protein Q4G21_09840 [Dermabacter sp.]|nr:hypothetical protein [Dermabacter sp.]